MGKFFDELSAAHRDFIARQHMYFVATAPTSTSGRVNLSPKGLETFRVLGPRLVAYLDLTGSGAETAAHLAENGRITVMFCAFEDGPMIMRLYGRGRSVRPHDAEWLAQRAHFGPTLAGERQIVLIEVNTVHTSCGYAVPLFDYVGQREQLLDWAEHKGPEGITAYQVEKNTHSIDGLPTFLNQP